MNFRPTASALSAAAVASALAAAFLAAPVQGQDPSKSKAPAVPPALSAPPASASGPVATVNGVVIPRQRADLLLRERTQQGQPDSPQLRAAVREELVNREIISQEAVKSGLTKKADLQNELELVRQTVIVQAYIRDYIRAHPLTDAEMQKEYDRVKVERGDKEYRARHILVGTEEEAKGLIGELKKGGKFEDLARKSSKDDGTKDKGGDLDWQVPTTFDKDFADAMVKLAKGKATETPVKTRFGFHVIQLDDIRAVQFPPFADVKANISQGMNGARIQKLIADLRAKAKVE